ncbi:MAG: transcriptional repressor LexA [Candidatus Liptonbacteria bacterium]|nr:transcriptional repressor LexA [Parcubacteria group bacterium]MBI4085712.1 transcriptional repressor LexA [Candidatus Liptonbacteria bacterium]
MLTKRQKEVLNFVESYSQKKGYAPSFEEIRKRLKLASVSTVHFHISKLKEGGYLGKIENRARAISITSKEPMVKIPLLGTIAAGQPIEAIQQKEMIAIPKSKIPASSEVYALRVVGSSMIDENINDGDIVLVRQQETAENGQKVVALIDNHEATLKKYYRERGYVRLQPANKSMEPIILRNGRDFSIQGIVLDVIREEGASTIQLPEYKEIEQHRELPLNEIICGDAIDVMKTFPPNSIDLVVTSPPYDELRNYKGYNFDFEGIAKGLFRVIKKGGVLVWVVGDKIKKGNKSLTSFKQTLFFQEIGFNVHDVMIYKKKNTPFMRTNSYTNCFEFMFVFSKGSPKTFNPLKTKTARQGQEMLPFNKGPDGINKKNLGELKPEKTMTNIWEYAVGLYGTTSDKIAFEHPAVFPEKLAEDHILSWTNQGDVVFDPMCGSGTTCKMALMNHRSYIGCDISKEYVELTKKRLKNI